jgi:hypothetical protein
MIRYNLKIFITILLFCSQLILADNIYYNYLNSNRGSLKELINSIMLDQKMEEEIKSYNQQKELFSPQNGTSSLFKVDASHYRENNRLSIIPDVKLAHRSLPGINDSGDYSASVFVRGGTSQETLTLINFFPIYNAYFFDGKSNLPNSYLIEQTKIYTAGIPVYYPDFLSGIIDIEEKKGDLYNYKYTIDQSITDFNFSMEGPISVGTGSFLFAARRTYYNYILQLLNKTNIIVPHLENYSQKIYYEFLPGQEIIFDFKNYYNYYKWNNKDFNLAQNGEHDFISKRNFFQTTYTGYWNNNLKTNLTFGLENSLSSKNILFLANNIHETKVEEPFFIKADLNLLNNSNNIFLTGLYYRKEKTLINNSFPKYANDYIIPDYSLYNSTGNTQLDYSIYGIYFHNEQSFYNDNLLVDLGARYSSLVFNNSPDKFSLQPRMGIKLREDNSSVKISIGKYSQFSPQKMNSQFIELLPEEAIQLNLAYEYKIDNNSELNFSFFNKDYSNLVNEEINTQGIIINYNNNKKGNVKGIEISYKNEEEDAWKFKIAYTNQQAYYADDIRISYPSLQNAQHSISLLGEVNLNTDWKIVIDWQYQSGKPYTDFTGATSSNIRDAFLHNLSVYNKSLLPDYNNLTIMVKQNKPIWPFTSFNGEFYLGVMNILNYDNIYAYAWENDYSEKKQVRMMPLTPIFGTRINF